MLRIFVVAGVFVIKSDDGVDIPAIEEFVGRIVVASGVMNESVDFQVGVEVAELRESDDGGDGVMAFRFD